MSADNIIDGWTQPTHAFEKSAELHLKIQTIEGVDPLDAQFGIDTPKTVPDALYEALFGQPEPTEDELAAIGDDPTKVPLMHTYAILDAAKITNLPELLEASDLEHRCLFKGNAYDALKDVAPWVVRLEVGNSFTRNLFTRSSAPWHQWWDSEPGIYVRSRGTLDEIWAHFRKFTRVQDADGKWYYFRFWEPKSVERMFSAFSHSESQHFLAPCFDLYTITLAPRVSCKRLFIEHSHFSVCVWSMVLKFSTAQFDAFAAPARAEWIAQAAQRLHQAYPEYFKTLDVEASALEPLCQAVEQWAAGYGVVGKRDVSQLCCVASTLGHKFWLDPRFGGYVNASMGNPDTPRGNAVGLLVSNASDWLDTLWRNDTFDRFVIRLDGYIRHDLEPNTQTLMDILPGHWALFDANTNERLMAWIIQNLPPIQSPAQRLVYVTCALVHGTGWVHDPQYGKILRAIKAASTPVELAASISAIYSEIR